MRSAFCSISSVFSLFSKVYKGSILCLIEIPFKTFANRAAWSGSTLFAYGNMIRYDPTLVDMTSVFFLFHVQRQKLIYIIIIHSGWSLAWIFMKERLISFSDEKDESKKNQLRSKVNILILNVINFHIFTQSPKPNQKK